MSFDIIPQIFYDFLCRIIPGSITILGVYLSIVTPSGAIKNLHERNCNLYEVVIIILISYIFGFILQQIWDSTLQKSKNIFRKHNETERNKNDEKKVQKLHKISENIQCMKNSINDYFELKKFFELIKNKSKGQIIKYPNIYMLHDHLRLTVPKEANRILKLRAEKRMFQALIIGFIVISFINPILNILIIHKFDTELAIFECISILFVFLFWQRKNRSEKYYIKSAITIWMLHNFPIGKNRANAPQNHR